MKTFTSKVFGEGDPSNLFLEKWAPTIYSVVYESLGPYGTEPHPIILPMSDGFHLSGATASFNMVTGQVTLSPETRGDWGRILEKITHEFVHGSLSNFPDGDPFYEEGQVDYLTFLLAHCPIWGTYRQLMIEAAKKNIETRWHRSYIASTDYDRKRWAGGLYARLAYGPELIGRLRRKKEEGDFTW
jgi:hypothetical protein